eukprot:COSAG01_NODE_650_length_14506_cov_24.157354_6_plen_114_part_00
MTHCLPGPRSGCDTDAINHACYGDYEHCFAVFDELCPSEVSRPFPSWNRCILTEIYLCHACSYQEINDGNGRAGPPCGHELVRSLRVQEREHEEAGGCQLHQVLHGLRMRRWP